MLPLNLHHTAVAVHDLDAALERIRSMFGAEPLSREVIEDQGVEEAMVPFGGSFLQVLMPLGEKTPVGRFLERHGEGMHHVAIQVADIDSALDHLRAEGSEVVDEAPRVGGGGNRIAFVHPRAFGGTLVELIEVV